MVLVKLTITAVIPIKHPATTKSFGSLVDDVIWKIGTWHIRMCQREYYTDQ